MRIVLFELRKIFAARYIIVAAIFAVLFLSLYMKEGLQIVGAYSYNSYFNEAAFSEKSDEFDPFGWFVETFGAKVTEETIARMEQMEYPELDEFLGTLDEFAEFDIHNTDELALFISKTTMDEYFCFEMLFGSFFYEKFENAGITLEEWNNDTSDIGNKLSRLSSVVPKAVGLIEDAFQRDRIYEQWLEFLACTRIRKLYIEVRNDPMYIFNDIRYWGMDMDHTLSAYRTEWYDNDRAYHHTKPSSYWESITPEELEIISEITKPRDSEKRITDRISALGDDFFYVRDLSVFWGWKGCGFGIIILSAVLCIIFAAPYAVADKRNIVPLQYTTKCGRNIERKKLCAVVLMAVIVSLISAIAVLLIMPHDVCAQWFGLPLTSFSAHDLLWLDVNMWQYIALYIGISFIVNISTAVIAYTVCGFTGNIISAVCISVPLIIAELLLWTNPLSHIFSLQESAAETPLWCIGIIVVAVLGAVFVTKRSRRPIQ